MNPEILGLKFDLMLAENELEVSLRWRNLHGWRKDPGSIILIKLEDLFCTEREFFGIVSWRCGGDHGCDETSSAGSYDQIKVFRQSSVFTFINSLDSQPCAPTTRSHQIPVSFLKKKIPIYDTQKKKDISV
jgi:hypothetical protein